MRPRLVAAAVARDAASRDAGVRRTGGERHPVDERRTRAVRRSRSPARGSARRRTEGSGVYVAFGPNPALHPSDWFNNISYYQTAVWVHPGGTGTATNKNMNANGTFSFTLTNADGSPLTAVVRLDQLPADPVRCRHDGGARLDGPVAGQLPSGELPDAVDTDPATRAGRHAVLDRRCPAFAASRRTSSSRRRASRSRRDSRLNPSTGVISGTPTAEGVFKVTVQGTDSTAPKPKKAKTKVEFRVAPAAITAGPSSLPNAQTGVCTRRQLTASGGVGPYKFKVTAGCAAGEGQAQRQGRAQGQADRSRQLHVHRDRDGQVQVHDDAQLHAHGHMRRARLALVVGASSWPRASCRRRSRSGRRARPARPARA